MKNVKLIFDSPDFYDNPNNYYIEGCSPTILNEIISYIKDNETQITEINASLYLYNNPVLHNFLKDLSDTGIKINIISIPLEGYDNRFPEKIVSLHDNDDYFENKPLTKYQIAKFLYTDIKLNSNRNFNMYIFPHMYLRSSRVKPFSRGNMPYSLHIKSFYIKFHDNVNSTILTSSNLAVRDKIKDEVMVIVHGSTTEDNSSQLFFDTLLSNSIEINDFDENGQYNHYAITQSETIPKQSNHNYMGPFLNNSQTAFEDYLKQLIDASERRIYLCGQHISAYEYWISDINGAKKRQGILKNIIKKTKKNIDINILSQTFVDNKGYSHGQRKPINKSSFMKFMYEFNISDTHTYAVNETVHLKFIVVDDTAVITSCNFTPTQFIYLDNINIPTFDNIPGVAYTGIHSEVGMYIIIKNKQICEKLIEQFECIRNRENTYHHY